MNAFKTAQEAFEFFYNSISKNGELKENTLFAQNIGFYIENPTNNFINTPWRKWSKKYAFKEFSWYLSQDRSVKDLIKNAPIWDKMHNGDYIVNSNYGYQWNRNDQLEKVIDLLKKNPNTRRAVLTIYDGKEIDLYEKDTPCTLNITFSIQREKLNMTVLMRSNDLWFGFCNDQFCFSELQKIIAARLGIKCGWYYHFANDLHIYWDFLNKNPNF